MSDLINLTIDGKACQAHEGDSLLNTARANDIFVPAVCYLTKCSPTLACRLCLVEVDGKQVYSCNAKVKEDMTVNTSNDIIDKERRAIMEVYDVNHPLQCGVCDQSGECELQNYSLYMEVDSQSYSIKDVPRPTSHWGVMNYDPGLCIVCEKCVTVCKDMIGSNALSTVKRGADPIAKSFKEDMPKDAYAMWNKLNKSIIGFEPDLCTDCGECISVCPVGALVSHDFQYKSNAWELTKIPASNPHTSDCTLMYYETKQESIANHRNQIIYRVTNEQHYASLNGAGRFGYDFENRIESKDEKAFDGAIESFKKAETIVFHSFITNEEAYLLQLLKEKLGCKLVNDDAYKYQQFLKAYSSISGQNLYSATLNDVHDSNFVISLGGFLKSDSPNSRYALNNSVILNKGAALYFHPMGDPIMELIGKKGKTTEFIYHKPLAEEAVLYLILDLFGSNLPASVQEVIDSKREKRVKTVSETVKEKIIEKVLDEETGEEKEVSKMVSKEVSKEVEYDFTTLLDEIGRDESLLELISSMLLKKDTFSLIIGEDLLAHPNAQNLAKLCGLINKNTEFKVLIIPSQTNTLGVGLICDLDEQRSGYTVGYNVKADFQLSALGDGDLDMPALNQQEGTFTNMNKRVVPTNAALPFNGYTLNEIANVILDVDIEHTIEYTSMLPNKSGFKNIDFDDLPNYYSNDQKEHRGYLLDSFEVQSNMEIEQPSQEVFTLNENEIVIYKANPMNQFNEFTAIAHEFKDSSKTGLYTNTTFLKSLDMKEGDKILVEANGTSCELEVLIDNQISGEIVYIPSFDKTINTQDLFDGYRYNNAVITKV
ncbi:MAG: NADH-quinone oxidoreductase subunit G [Campylobacteraceae bacterium]|nr:NADH-quinone oxidoreductase subunit G [Campylobacteraceae bacterium]